jgi:hypothetical protein
MKTLLLTASVLILIVCSCTFTKTLYYNTANITDYKIFRNREVKADNHQAWKISENYNKSTISEKYIEVIDDIETVSFLVVHKGEILHEEYWDKFDMDTYSNSFSMAKSFISLLIGFAIDDGYIKDENGGVHEKGYSDAWKAVIIKNDADHYRIPE